MLMLASVGWMEWRSGAGRSLLCPPGRAPAASTQLHAAGNARPLCAASPQLHLGSSSGGRVPVVPNHVLRVMAAHGGAGSCCKCWPAVGLPPAGAAPLTREAARTPRVPVAGNLEVQCRRCASPSSPSARPLSSFLPLLSPTTTPPHFHHPPPLLNTTCCPLPDNTAASFPSALPSQPGVARMIPKHMLSSAAPHGRCCYMIGCCQGR